MVNEQNVEGLASPTDVVGNIKSGKRASQKRGDPRSHERCKSNMELVEGEGPLYRVRPHQGRSLRYEPLRSEPLQGGTIRGDPHQGGPLQYGPLRGAPCQGGPLRGRTYECGPR